MQNGVIWGWHIGKTNEKHYIYCNASDTEVSSPDIQMSSKHLVGRPATAIPHPAHVERHPDVPRHDPRGVVLEDGLGGMGSVELCSHVQWGASICEAEAKLCRVRS